MYGNQPVVNSGQMHSVMQQQHQNMLINSPQSHVLNTPHSRIRSQTYYTQGMMNAGQSMPGQGHLTQPMMGQGIVQAGHLTANPGSHQQMTQVQVGAQQAYIQQQPMSAHSSYAPGRQSGSPSLGSQIISHGTPGGGGLSSGSGPPSNNPQTPLNALPCSVNPASQQAPTPNTPQQISSVQSGGTQEGFVSAITPDPISSARNLLLKELRYSALDWSKAAAEIVRPTTSRHQQESTNVVHNPLSVNPQSVNPLSANPSSVKSLDEPKSVEAIEKRILSPNENYISCFDNILGVCDHIESNFFVIQEAHKQSTKFDKMFAGELKAVGDMANANYSQYAQGYVESTARIRAAINRTIRDVGVAVERMSSLQGKQRKEEDS